MADLIRLEVFVAPHQSIDAKTAAKLCRMHNYPFEYKSSKHQKPQKQNRPKPVNKEIEAPQESSNQTFSLRKGVIIRSGLWIKDSEYGLGKILHLNTGKPGEDTHTVWFCKGKKIYNNHTLRGRTKEILHVSKIPVNIQKTAPSD